MNAWSGGAPIDFTAVPHLDDFNGARCVIVRIDDTELTPTNAVAPFGSGKPFATRGSRIGGKRDDAVDDALTILFLIKPFDLLIASRCHGGVSA